MAPVPLKRKRDTSAEPKTDPPKRAYMRVPDEVKLWFVDFHAYQARVHGKSLAYDIRRAKHLVPELFGPVAPDTFRRWHDGGAHDHRGRPSVELPPFALSRLANLTHAVAARLSLSVLIWQHVYRRVLRELDIEFEPTDHWTLQFLHSLQLSWKLAATCTRHRPSEADFATERKLLQLRVIYLCDRYKISQDRTWNLDETAVRMVPAGDRGWTKKAESQYLMKTLVALEDDKDPDRENEHLYRYLQFSNDESAAVQPHCRVSGRSRSPQGKDSPQRQKGKKNTAEVKKPRELPKAKKHKPVDSDDDDDEVPRNEPGTSSNTQPPVPALPLQSGSTSSSHGPSTSTTSTSSQRKSTSSSSEDESADNEDGHGEGESGPAIQSARSQEYRRTVLHPDLFVLTNDEYWTMTPEAHKYATAAAGSFCFVTTENGEQQDVYTVPCVQRSLCLDELTNVSNSAQVEFPKGVDSQTRDMLKRCMATCGKAAGARAKRRSRARKEAQLRMYEDITSSLLKRNTSSGYPGLTMRLLMSLV